MEGNWDTRRVKICYKRVEPRFTGRVRYFNNAAIWTGCH